MNKSITKWKGHFKGDTVYFLKPVNGIFEEMDGEYGYFIYELAKAEFIEYCTPNIDRARIIEKGCNYTRDVKLNLITETKKEGEILLKEENRNSWKNIFDLIKNLTGKVNRLEERFNKLNKI